MALYHGTTGAISEITGKLDVPGAGHADRPF